jgi:AcrR family transcriptional regulator
MNENSKNEKPSRKEREFMARRREILEAAAHVIAQKGYHGAAMSEIAAKAEFSTGSLYNFFKNKEELYFSLIHDKIEALEAEVEDVYGSPGDTMEVLESYVKRVMSFFQRERDFFRIFAEQQSSFESSAKGQFQDIVNEKMERYLSLMVDLMGRGTEEGALKPYPPSELAMSFLGLIHGYLFVLLNSKEPVNMEQKSGELLDIFFNGTRRKPGEEGE